MAARSIRLQSTEMIHTPGMIVFARNAFRSPTRKDREVAIDMLVDGYGLPRFVAWGLLDGCIPHEVQGDCVVFEVDTAPRGVETKDQLPDAGSEASLRAILGEFVEDINSTGGLVWNAEHRQMAPNADWNWTGLAETYTRACAALGVEPLHAADDDDADDLDEVDRDDEDDDEEEECP